MDPLTLFCAGATLWTALHFIPGRTKLNQDELILKTWEQTGTTNKECLLPVKKKGAWFLPAGLSPRDIEKTIPALAYQLNAHIEMETRGKAVLLHVHPGQLPRKVPYTLQDLSRCKLGLVMGHTWTEACLTFDLNDSNPYILTAGGVGMGKSNWLNLVLRQINDNYTPDQVQYFLIDLKLGVELGQWADSPMCAGTCWDPSTDQLPAMLGYLTREVRRRMKLFKKHGVYKVDEYNRLDVKQLPYLLLVVDEYAELNRDKDAEDKLQSLLQIGRAAGLRVIMSTQRPTHDNINTSIKGLIPTRLCFSVADRVNSDVVLDQSGAEDLGGIPGRALLLSGARLREVQVMIAS